MTLWFALMGKLKTGDFLVEKGILVAQHALYPFCNLEVESNSHILFTCKLPWGIWMRLLVWWGIKRVLHHDCVCFVDQWNNLLVARKGKKLWRLCLCCVIWSLWLERNRVKFESIILDHDSFLHSLKLRIGVWAKELLGYITFSPHDVIYNLDSML